MTMIDILQVISICASVVAVFGVIYGAYHNKARKDSTDKCEFSNEGKEAGSILSDLGYIKSSIDNLNNKMDKQNETNTNMIVKLTHTSQILKILIDVLLN